jgi:hypothetical protein
MCDLHKESAHQRLADIHVQLALICRAYEIEVEPFHQAFKLVSHIFGLLECTLGEVVIPAPVFVVFVYQYQNALVTHVRTTLNGKQTNWPYSC